MELEEKSVSSVLTISEVSKFLDVSEKTLRIWDKKNILPAFKTEGGHRRYSSESVRNFLKSSIPSKNILEEFIEGDVRVRDNQVKKDYEFWHKKGYLNDSLDKKDQENLAVLLSNQLSYSAISGSEINGADDLDDDEFYLKLIINVWNRLVSKMFIGLGAMTGPTGLVYYLRQREPNTLCIESEAIGSTLRKMETPLILLNESRKPNIKMLHPDTFETIEKEISNPKPYQNDIDEEWILNYSARKLSNEINNEIVQDLWQNGQIEKVRNFYDLAQYGNCGGDSTSNYLITNEMGIELLKKKDLLPEIREGFVADEQTRYVGVIQCRHKVFYNPTINGAYFGYAGNSSLDKNYFYSIYVPLTPAPFRLGENDVLERAWLMRYAKKLIENRRTVKDVRILF